MQLEKCIATLDILASLAEVIPVLGTPLRGGSEALSKILKYAQDVKTQKVKVLEIAELAARWCGTMTNVLQNAQADRGELERLRDYVQDLVRSLEAIAVVIERWKGQSYMERIWRKSKDAEELTALRERLHDSFERFMMGSHIRTEMELAAVKADLRIVRSDADRDILQSLNHVSSALYDSLVSPSGCLPGTRTAVLEETLTWAGTSSDHCCIYWLTGLAGTGKSSIAKSFCELMAQNGQYRIITFFVSKNSAERRNPFYMLHTLALELANSYPQFRERLVLSMRGYKGIEYRPLKEQMNRMLKTPLEETIKDLGPEATSHTPVFVIDALNECLNINEVEGSSLIVELAEALSSLPVKIFVTSRMDTALSQVFDTLANTTTFKLHEIEKTQIAADVRLILSTGFSSIAAEHSIIAPVWPLPHDLDTLISQTGHLIIFATTALRYIGDSRIAQPEDRLRHVIGHDRPRSGNSLPYAEVDMLYMDILSSAVSVGLGKPDLLLADRLRQVVGTVIVAEEPLNVTAISEILGTREREVYADLHAMTAVMTLTSDKSLVSPTVRIFHPSFREFLLERCSDPLFRIDPVPIHAALANQCLDILIRDCHNAITHQGATDGIAAQSARHNPSLLSEDSEAVPDALRYAGVFWLKHVSLATVQQQHLARVIYDFATTCILHWLQLLSRLDFLSHTARLLPAVLEWCEINSDLDLIHEAYILLNDALRIMQTYHPALRTHSSHVYHSALLTMPECLLFQAIREHCYEAHASPRLVSQRPSDWPVVRVVMEGHSGNVMSAAFSYDGNKIVSASTDTSIRVWDAHIGREIGALPGHSGIVWSVSFSPDNDMIISGSQDCTVRIWDAHLYVELGILRGHSGSVNCVAFSSDSTQVVSGSDDKSVRIWNILSGAQALLRVFEGHSGPVQSVAFSHNGLQVVSGSDDHSIRLWSCHGNEAVALFEGHTDSVNCVSFTPDDEILVSGSSDITVRIWDVISAREIDALQGHLATVWSVAVSTDGSTLLSGSSDSTVRVWDLTTADHEELLVLEGHDDWVRCVAFAPTHTSVIVSSSDDSTVRLWDFRDSSSDVKQKVLEKDKSERLRSITFSPDGTRIATTSDDNTIQLWNAQHGLQIHNSHLEGHCASALSEVEFSPDSAKLASASSNDLTIWIWAAQDGALINVIEGHENWISCVAFSPDGDQIISGSCDSTIGIWDVDDGLQFAQFVGHRESVISVKFSPDGSKFVSSSDDRTIWLWDVSTASGRQVLNLDDQSDYVSAVTFNATGTHIITECDSEMIAWIVPGLAGIPQTMPSHMDETFSHVSRAGICWDFRTGWISWQDPSHDANVRLSWIPPELRSQAYATTGTVVALARVIEGVLTILDFADVVPPIAQQ